MDLSRETPVPLSFIPSYKRQFTANRVFTDREQPITRFLRAFDPPPPPDQHRSLVFYGVGGEGKTALAHHLVNFLQTEYAGRAGWATVNFHDTAMRRTTEALLSIRLQLRSRASLPFPAFDTAFAQWFGKTYPGDSIRQRHPGLFRSQREGADDAFSFGLDVLDDMDGIIGDVASEIPGIGLIWKYGNRFHYRFREWFERRGKEVLNGIEKLQADQLLDRLPTYIGVDLTDAANDMIARGTRKPLTIIADTMEAFHRGEAQQGGGFTFRNDHWVRNLIKETPGVLFVLLSRDALNWAEIDNTWNEILDQHQLGALSRSDADKFLLNVPVAELEIRARMIDGARGLPFYLNLQVDLYESLKNQERMPKPEQFGGNAPEILHRFLDHLGQTTARALTILANCRRFEESLWLHLGQNFMGGSPPISFGGLRGFSLVEELDGGWYSLHALMRESLNAHMAEQEPVLSDQVQRCLFAWWDKHCEVADLRSITSANELALEEAAFHRTTFERETFGDWAEARGKPFCQAARFMLVQRLWELSLSIEEKMLGRDDLKVARTLGNLGILYERKGELDAAQATQERVLAIKEKVFGRDHLRLAATLCNLGIILGRKGKLAEALDYNLRALAIEEKERGSDDASVAATLINMGAIYLRMFEPVLRRAYGSQKRLLDIAQYSEKQALKMALESQKRAQNILRNTPGADPVEIARNLGNLGIAYLCSDDLDNAEYCLESALNIKRQILSPDHPEFVNSFVNLGNIYNAKKQFDLAVDCYNKALVIVEKAFDP